MKKAEYMEEDDFPKNFDEYELVDLDKDYADSLAKAPEWGRNLSLKLEKIFKKLPIKSPREIMDDFEVKINRHTKGEGIDVNEWTLTQDNVMTINWLYTTFFLIALPNYLATVGFISLITSYTGTDEKGERVGFLEFLGATGSMGIGKSKSFTILHNKIKNRRKFAWTTFLIGTCAGIGLQNLVVDGLSYEGLEGLISNENNKIEHIASK